MEAYNFQPRTMLSEVPTDHCKLFNFLPLRLIHFITSHLTSPNESILMLPDFNTGSQPHILASLIVSIIFNVACRCARRWCTWRTSQHSGQPSLKTDSMKRLSFALSSFIFSSLHLISFTLNDIAYPSPSLPFLALSAHSITPLYQF